MKIIEAYNLSKKFGSKEEGNLVWILKNINFTLQEGESIGIIGSSGCGKTTLLQILGQIDNLYSGEMKICGIDCVDMAEKKKSELLAKKISFIYQFHHLLPEFTALENVTLSCLIAGMNAKEAKKHSLFALNELGLAKKAENLPSMLSGGERQRVAIARAIAKRPRVVFADEPTGNLDPKTSDNVFKLLTDLIKSLGLSLVCVTHNPKLVKLLNKSFTIQDANLSLLAD